MTFMISYVAFSERPFYVVLARPSTIIALCRLLLEKCKMFSWCTLCMHFTWKIFAYTCQYFIYSAAVLLLLA